jgi:hypothetical protein
MASSFFRPNFVPWPFIYRNLTQPDAICRPGRIALPSPTSILFRIVLLVWRTGVMNVVTALGEQIDGWKVCWVGGWGKVGTRKRSA